jgi:hypothetical protein
MTATSGPPNGVPSRSYLHCPLCNGNVFDREESRQDSRWGFTRTG